MKTKTFLTMICLFVLISCSKEDQNRTEPDTKFAMENAGLLHNYALNYYYSQYEVLQENSVEKMNLTNVLDICADFLIGYGFESIPVLESKNKIMTNLDESMKKNSESSFFTEIPGNFQEMTESTATFSQDFISQIMIIIEFATKNKEIHQIKEYVNSEFSKLAFDKSEDIVAQKIFTDIFNSSYEYWLENPTSSAKKSTKIKNSSWVIINDGIGGIIGSAFGPLGSIMLGTAFSIGTNEELD